MLGHFRHEVGHYYQHVLVESGSGADRYLDDCRRLFGDERASYGDAISRHYKFGAPDGWHEAFISEYATMHPWEDFAECFAHYLHITDTIDTSREAGMVLRADLVRFSAPRDIAPLESYDDVPIERLLFDWRWMSLFFNRVNTAMGKNPLYPFEIPATGSRQARVHPPSDSRDGPRPIRSTQMGYADELFDLTDRVVLVTGGSRGLGREMAFAAARCGADVIIASRKYESCVATAEEIAAATGRTALPYAGARRALGRARRSGRRGLRPVRQGRRADQQRGHVAALRVAELASPRSCSTRSSTSTSRARSGCRPWSASGWWPTAAGRSSTSARAARCGPGPSSCRTRPPRRGSTR